MPSKTKAQPARISKITGKPVRPYNRKATSPGHREMVVTTSELAPKAPAATNALAIFKGKADVEVVVSANYRDRNSPYRWIVRKIGDSIALGIAVKRVICPNPVAFINSRAEGSEGETGFGCKLLARTSGVVVDGVLPPSESSWHPSYKAGATGKKGRKVREDTTTLLPAEVLNELVPIHFNGLYLERGNGDWVNSAAGLVMHENGKILAAKPSRKELTLKPIKRLG